MRGHWAIYKPKERGLEQNLPSQPSEATKCPHLDLGLFQPPELGDNAFLLFKPPVCGILFQQPE